MSELGDIKLNRIEDFCKRLQRDMNKPSSEIDVSFEMFMVNFYPTIMDNIKAQMTLAYRKGLEDRETNEN